MLFRSAEPGNIRIGGGGVPEDDPASNGVHSNEVGIKSNVVVSIFLNKNEPTGQIQSINDFGVEIDDRESTFIFDEIGIYSPGKSAASTYGYSSVNVGDRTSEDVSLLLVNTSYTFDYVVDGVAYSSTVQTPSGGSGPDSAITYGDICEGLNSGLWVTAGDDFAAHAFIFITDRTGGLNYTTISNKESYGLLTVQSLTTGDGSSVFLSCDGSSATDILKAITNNACINVNVGRSDGSDAGVYNDIAVPENERERLLTHLVFPPITKTADKALKIVYTLTVSVARTSDSRVNQITTIMP